MHNSFYLIFFIFFQRVRYNKTKWVTMHRQGSGEIVIRQESSPRIPQVEWGMGRPSPLISPGQVLAPTRPYSNKAQRKTMTQWSWRLPRWGEQKGFKRLYDVYKLMLVFFCRQHIIDINLPLDNYTYFTIVLLINRNDRPLRLFIPTMMKNWKFQPQHCFLTFLAIISCSFKVGKKFLPF